MTAKKNQKSKRLGPYLRESRIRAGLSQKDVSKALGYQTGQFISEWERGVRSPPGATLRKLVDLYEISVAEFYEVLRTEQILRIEEDLKKALFGTG